MMRDWLAGQLDYIVLWHGLASVILAGVCLRLREPLPFRWLALFGVLHAVSTWLDLLAAGISDRFLLAPVRLAALAASYLVLLEFASRARQAQRGWTPRRWVHLALLGLVFAGGLTGLEGLRAACHYALGLPACALVSWMLLEDARHQAPARRRCLRAAALVLCAFGLAAALSLPGGERVGANAVTLGSTAAALVLFSQLLQALCLALLAVPLSRVYARKEAGQSGRVRGGLVAAVTLLILAGGWWATVWSGARADDDLRETILRRATEIAETISPDRVKSLTFTPADANHPEFQRLRAQLIAFGRLIQQRSIYTIALRDGQIVFGPENLAENDPFASPPGTVYEEPTPADFELLRTGRACTEGPCTDQYGTFISAFAPVRDPRSGDALMAVGIDAVASEWYAELARHRLVPIAFTGALALLLLLAEYLPARQRRPFSNRRAWLLHKDVLLTSACGAVLSVGAALLAHHLESDSRQTAFTMLAEAQAGTVVTAMHDLRDDQLAGLGQLFESSDYVTRPEFERYTRHLRTSGTVQAWSWLPAVTSETRTAVEDAARDDGLADYAVWQLDADHGRRPVAQRDIYYPVLYCEPREGNEAALGFDVASEPLRRVALETAARTGLPTATDPLALVPGCESEWGLLVFRPVFDHTEAGPPRGFVVAVLRLASLLRLSLAQRDPQSSAVIVELHQLGDGTLSRFLATSSLHGGRTPNATELVPCAQHGNLHSILPLFAFGKTYALLAHPGPEFLAAHPVRAGRTVAALGLLLTLATMTLVGSLSHRRAILQQEVEARTAALEATRQAEEVARREEARAKCLLELSQMTACGDDEVVAYALTAGIHLTHSSTGYIAFVDQGEQAVRMVHWPSADVDHCSLAERPALDGAAATGPWDEVLRRRESVFARVRDASGALLHRMDLPVLEAGRIVLVAGVANRERRYSADDRTQLALLMDGMWRTLQRRQAESAKSLLRSLLDHTNDAIEVVDPESGRFLDVNEHACTTHGYTRAEYLSLRVPDVDPLVAKRPWSETMDSVRRDGTLVLETLHRRKDGSVFPVEVNATCVHLDREYLLAVVRDVSERKRAEEALRTSEERFRTLVANIPGVVLRCDARPPWKVHYCSDAVLEIAGYPAGEYTSGARTFADDIPPDDLKLATRDVLAAITDHRPYAVELRMIHADGGVRWIHARGQATYHADGTPLWIDGVLLDVTTRKSAEAALQQSVEKSRAIVENIGIGVALIDPQMRILELNRQMREWFPSIETQPPPLCHASFNEPPRESPCDPCPTKLTLRDGRVHETIVHTPQGDSARDYRIVSSAVRDQQGEVVAAIELVEDVTARHQAERALAETARLQTEINHVQQSLLGPGELADKLKTITDAAVQWFGVDFCRIWITRPGDRCETGCWHAQPDRGPDICRRRFGCLHLIASSGRYTHTDGQAHSRVPYGCDQIGLVASGSEHRLLTNDVTRDPRIHNRQWARELGLVSFAGYQLRPSGGETIGVLALFSKHAITPEVDALLESLANTAAQVIQSARAAEEQRSLQSQLIQAQRLEPVGQLAAGIAHEINTPTQFVSDNTRFLRTAFPKLQDLLFHYRRLAEACRAAAAPPELLAELETAVKTAKLDYLLEQIPEAIGDSLEGLERVTKIVRAMKDFAHPGEQTLSPADLNKAIESTVTVARNEWKYVAEMKLELDPDLPPVPCQVADFNQVILNIVVNAAHAIQDVGGGEKQAKGTITIATRQVGDRAEIRISDTGTGIPVEHRDKVFNHFFTTKEVGKGTGQGLAIARRVIVEKHRGTLTFETEVGRGTTFIIRLPLDSDAKSITEKPEHELAHSAG